MATDTPEFLVLKTTSKAISTNVELALRENDRRRYLLIQNTGSQAVYIAFGDTYGPLVSATTGIKLAAGGQYQMDRSAGNMTGDKVYAKAAASNTTLTITEGALAGQHAVFAPPAAGNSSSSESSSSPSSDSSSSPSSASSSSLGLSSSSESSASSESSSSP